MVIRISVKSDTKPLQGYSAFLKNAQRANQDIMQLTVQKNINTYLRPMEQIDPGPSLHGGYAGAWSTNPKADARARRWWFANLHDGRVGGGRTGALNRSWHFVSHGNRLSLENNSPAAAYVLSMAKQVRARGGRPNPGHIRTRWSEVTKETANRVLLMVIEDIKLSWAKSIAASVAAGQYRIVIP